MIINRDCPVCGANFIKCVSAKRFKRGHPRFCSRACANRAPGRMTAEIRSRIGRKGPAHHNYKGGWRSVYGYVFVGDKHRSHLVWNQIHPDDLVKPGEVIHHINEIKDDDRPENLQKFPSNSEHWRHHAKAIARNRKRDANGRFMPSMVV